MRKTLIFLVFPLFVMNPAFAAAPSDESVAQLLTLQEVEKAPAFMLEQLDAMAAGTVRQATQGRVLSSEEEKVVKTFELKSDAVKAELQERISFDKLKPGYVKIYKTRFSQDEVDQLIAFYQTPTGKMLLAKMPLVTQDSSALIQQNVTPLFQRMQQAAGEMRRQLDALRAPKPQPAPQTPPSGQ
jgi:hypothetical protein